MKQLQDELELLYQRLCRETDKSDNTLDQREILAFARKLDELIDRYFDICNRTENR
jgi:hypothetical protein